MILQSYGEGKLPARKHLKILQRLGARKQIGGSVARKWTRRSIWEKRIKFLLGEGKLPTSKRMSFLGR